MKDPNTKVDGIAKLKSAGIDVLCGIMEKECQELNEIFLVNQIEKRTFIALKTASTLDGKIAAKSGDSKWITGEKARLYSKKLRKQYDAILTSSSTIIADNPEMKHSVKIILDRNLKTDFYNSKIYKQGEIYVFCADLANPPNNIKNINFIKTPVIAQKLDLKFIFKKLYELGIMSVFVEAGGKLSGEILPFADKVYHFIAPKITGDNNAKSVFDFRNIDKISQCLNFKFLTIKKIANDMLVIYKK